MATKSENSDIAVLQTQMANVVDTVKRIELKLDTQNGLFVTKGEFDEFKKRWLFSHTIVGIISSVLTGLIVFYFTRT